MYYISYMAYAIFPIPLPYYLLYKFIHFLSRFAQPERLLSLYYMSIWPLTWIGVPNIPENKGDKT